MKVISHQLWPIIFIRSYNLLVKNFQTPSRKEWIQYIWYIRYRMIRRNLIESTKLVYPFIYHIYRAANVQVNLEVFPIIISVVLKVTEFRPLGFKTFLIISDRNREFTHARISYIINHTVWLHYDTYSISHTVWPIFRRILSNILQVWLQLCGNMFQHTVETRLQSTATDIYLPDNARIY